MTVYVDDMREYPIGNLRGLWCHMWTDEQDESGLHELARSIDIKRSWFQTGNPRFHHYDLRKSKRALALKYGAVYKPLHEWVREHPLQVLKEQTES